MSGCDRYIGGVRCGGTHYARGTGPNQCGCDDGPEKSVHRFQVTLLVEVVHDTSDPWDAPNADCVSDAFLDALDGERSRHAQSLRTDYGRRIELSDDYRRAIKVVEL